MTNRFQPMQPIETDSNGTKRFRQNQIVRYLLDNGGIDLKQLARIGFMREDRAQFMQLIGYSVSAAPLTDDMINAAESVTEEGACTDRDRIAFLEEQIAAVRASFQQPVANLFNINPHDLDQGAWCGG